MKKEKQHAAKDPSMQKSGENQGGAQLAATLITKAKEKRAFLGVVLALLALLGIAFWVVAMQSQQLDEQKTRQEVRQDRVEEVNNLMGRGEYEQALATIENYFEEDNDAEEQAELYLLKSSVYVAQDKLDEALEAVITADQLNSSYDTVSAIVGIAYLMKNNELLKEYLPKQIELLDPEDPVYEDTKRSLEALLEEIGG